MQPVIERDGYRFTVKVGKPPAEAKDGTKLSARRNFRCLMSGTPIEPDYIKRRSEGRADGAEADGDCRRGNARTRLSCADARA